MSLKFTCRKWISILLIGILALVCLAPASAPAFGASGAEWLAARGDLAEKGVTTSATPRSAAETFKKWSVNIDPGNSSAPVTKPLIIGDRLYVATAKGDPSFIGPSTDARILVYGKAGNLILEKKLPTAVGLTYSSGMGYGDGKLFLPVYDGSTNEANIIAFDAKTLNQLWVSEKLPAYDEIVSALYYRNGYLYGGASGGWTPTSTTGCFFAIAGADADASRDNEVKAFQWKYVSDQPAKGFYTAGAVFTKNAVFFAGDNGVLISHGLTAAGSVLDALTLDGRVRSELFIKNNVIYAVTQNGTAYRIPVTDGGAIDKGAVKTFKVSGGESTSTPVVYRNKLYLFSGKTAFVLGENKGVGKLDVLNATTMAKLSTVDLGECTQSSPLLTSAYATAANKYAVYLYVLLNADKDDVLCIRDSDALKAPAVSKIFSPGGSNTSNSLIADGNGQIFFSHSITVDPITFATTNELISIGTLNVKVSFNVNGGKAIKTKSKSVAFGQTLGTLPTPAWKNTSKGFIGWYTAKKGGSKVSAATTMKKKTTQTYYARWGNRYKVTFNANQGRVSVKSRVFTKGAVYKSLPTPARKGYKFTGWYTKKAGGAKIAATSVVKISKAATFYAHWKKK